MPASTLTRPPPGPPRRKRRSRHRVRPFAPAEPRPFGQLLGQSLIVADLATLASASQLVYQTPNLAVAGCRGTLRRKEASDEARHARAQPEPLFPSPDRGGLAGARPRHRRDQHPTRAHEYHIEQADPLARRAHACPL